jgi:predicted N-formylglutamate amidohydrolase
MNPERRIILSCEHAGNRVPRAYKHLFAADPHVLTTHRGYDIGIAPVAAALQQALDCPLCVHPWTRLLVDVNRTHRPSLFSEFSKPLHETEKQHLIDAYYTPYQEQLGRLTAEAVRQGPVLHVSLHSFTPELRGEKRNADIGILYDPARSEETACAKALLTDLQERSGLRIRRNYPYRGRADGMTRRFRRQYPQLQYIGLELEFNQALLTSLPPKHRRQLVDMLVHTMSHSNRLPDR